MAPAVTLTGAFQDIEGNASRRRCTTRLAAFLRYILGRITSDYHAGYLTPPTPSVTIPPSLSATACPSRGIAMSALSAHTIVNPENSVLHVVQEQGHLLSAAQVISEISRRYGLSESVVRGAVWDLIAEGTIELSSDRHLAVVRG